MRTAILQAGTRFARRSRSFLENVRENLGFRYYHELNLPYRGVGRILHEAGADEWFIWSIRNRARRGEAVAAMNWITGNVDRRVLIFETGCGCAANLIWLGQHGFYSLAGRDVNPEAIAAARNLADFAGLQIDLAVDDGLHPRLPNRRAGLLLALNWLYYHPQLDLCSLLTFYRNVLEPMGLVVFDMVHSEFNSVPDNQYRTDDWHLPPGQRRPTQYKIRMTPDNVRVSAHAAGFEIVSILPGTRVPPRFVAILRMCSPGHRTVSGVMAPD